MAAGSDPPGVKPAPPSAPGSSAARQAPSSSAAGSAGEGAPQPRRWWSLRRKVIAAIAGLLLLYGAYVVSLQFFAYTSDAFAATDVVLVAPEVGGRIVAVHVADNQLVRAGDVLLEIDPEPYALKVDLRMAELTKALADEESAARAVDRARADREQASVQLALDQRTERRYADLVQKGAVSQLAYDEVKTKRLEAEAKLRAASAALDAAQQQQVAQRAAVGVARRALDLARYDLGQTRLLAPVDGYVNNLWLRVGDYARASEPRIGIVASDRWRVIALYKEEAIRHLTGGQRVWVYLDIYPYQLFHGRVQGVARGIAREDAQTSLLPKIEPTTGWIRFQRRLPVHIQLEDVPEDIRLHVGTNARTLAVYGF